MQSSLFPKFFPDQYSREAFEEDVENFAFLAIRSLIELAYKEAVVEAHRLYTDRPEIYRMIGQIRHSLVEQELRSLGRRGDIPSLLVRDEVLRTRRGFITSGSYVAVYHKDIVITQSHTDHISQFPATAVFRKNMARLNQWTLEETLTESGPEKYMIVTHGPLKTNPEELGFIQVGFPYPDGSGYLHQYDLFNLPTDKIIGVTNVDNDVEIDLSIIDNDEIKSGG